MKRSELARATGANAETVRFYEKIGLMPDPPRSAGGHRVYDEDHVRRLTFIRRGRALGFGVDDVRRLLQLMDTGSVTCEEVRNRTLSHLADVRAKIADLRRLERVLADTAAKCAGGDAPDCPILEALAGGQEPATKPL